MLEVDDLLKYWTLLLIRAVLRGVEWLTDLLFGVTFSGGTRADREKARRDYGASAHLVRLLWRARSSPFSFRNARIDNFLYVHEDYVHPNYILENRNVSLLAVEKTYALFCLTDPALDISDVARFPFQFLSQYREAQRLIILPTERFHQLAEEVGDPKVPVGLVHMSGRSGSTLLAQILHRVPSTRAISESKAMVNVNNLRTRGLVTPEESRKLLQSAMRLHCKVSPGEHVERIFMKMTIMHSQQFRDLGDLFPHFKFFFSTRHPVPSLRSYLKIFKVVHGRNLYNKLGLRWRDKLALRLFLPYHPKFDSFVAKYHPWHQPCYPERCLLYYTGSLACYFTNRKMYHRVILYENLCENPHQEVGEILKLMEIPEEHLAAALGAFERDSQNKTFGERGHSGPSVLTDKILDLMDQHMADLDIPVRHAMSVEEFKKLFGF